MQFFIIAFSLGFLGSLHCVGMCGPISLALPIGKFSPLNKFIAIITYNAGRIITYSVIGLIIGIFGNVALVGLQQNISTALGIFLIVSVTLPFFNFFKKASFRNHFLLLKIKRQITSLFQKKTLSSFLLIGLLNGLLPCGLVYVALSSTFITHTGKEGALYMASFGLGTIPAMLAVNYAGKYIINKFKFNINKAIPIFIVLLGCMMIVRGMNLGVPYLSPKADVEKKTIHSCCETK